MNIAKSRGVRTLPTLLVVLAVIALGVWLGRRLGTPPEPPKLTGGTLLPQPQVLAPFHLVDSRGHPFGPAQVKGEWTFLFFGYTHCPDVCPTTLSLLNVVAGKLGRHPGVLDDTRFVFISVDPQRDTPQVLAQYVPFFNRDFIGATGSPEEIGKLARQLGVMYFRNNKGKTSDNYEIDHSTGIMLLDKQGRYAALFPAPHDAGTIAADFLKIRKYYN